MKRESQIQVATSTQIQGVRREGERKRKRKRRKLNTNPCMIGMHLPESKAIISFIWPLRAISSQLPSGPFIAPKNSKVSMSWHFLLYRWKKKMISKHCFANSILLFAKRIEDRSLCGVLSSTFRIQLHELMKEPEARNETAFHPFWKSYNMFYEKKKKKKKE